MGHPVVPNPIGCAVLNEKNTNVHHFGQATCYSKPSIHERSLIQIKFLRGVNYVYCPSKNIEFFHIKKQCPNYVFFMTKRCLIPNQEFKYRSQAIKITHELNMSGKHSFRIIFQYNSGIDVLLEGIKNHSAGEMIQEISPPFIEDAEEL